MLLNYLLTAKRNLLRHKRIFFLNLFGLSIGIATCILIFLLIRHELSYDSQHHQGNRIYRIVQHQQFAGAAQQVATTSGMLGPAMEQEFPEVEKSVRLLLRRNILVGNGMDHYPRETIAMADSTFFKVFDVDFIAGNPATAITRPQSMVLTESAARRYFGKKEALGQYITIANRKDYTVTGIIRDLPDNAHFHFDGLTSLEVSGWMKNWYISGLWTYVLLKEHSDATKLDDKLPLIISKYRDPKDVSQVRLHLQPMKDIHLHSNMAQEIEANGDMAIVWIFSFTALVILSLAGVNYVTLVTAQHHARLKEIGIRKAIGAHRGQLVAQFLTESYVVVFLSFILALLLSWLCLPLFNRVTQQTFDWTMLFLPGNLLSYLVGILIFGALAGGYPALYLSRFTPTAALRAKVATVGRSGFTFRMGAVIFQFTVSIILIISSLVASQQLSYISDKSLGYNKAQLLNVVIRDPKWFGNTDPIKQAFLKTPGVVKVAATLNPLGDELDASDVKLPATTKEETRLLAVSMVDYDYLQTLELPIVAGRGFSSEYATDTTHAFIINETAARKFGWKTAEEAIGKELEYLGGDRVKEPVIGVVKDFHMASLHQEIQPLLLLCWPSRLSSLVVRIKGEDREQTLAGLRSAWQQFGSPYPLEISFVSDALDALYLQDKQARSVINLFMTMAIVIAGLGLFGLSALTAQQRTKEMAIRRTLGASATHVVLLLYKSFVPLVLVANVIAWPVAWWLTRRWLEDFSYRTSLNYLNFFYSGVAALIVAIATVSYHALRTARQQPVTSLRKE